MLIFEQTLFNTKCGIQRSSYPILMICQAGERNQLDPYHKHVGLGLLCFSRLMSKNTKTNNSPVTINQSRTIELQNQF